MNELKTEFTPGLGSYYVGDKRAIKQQTKYSFIITDTDGRHTSQSVVGSQLINTVKAELKALFEVGKISVESCIKQQEQCQTFINRIKHRYR